MSFSVTGVPKAVRFFDDEAVVIFIGTAYAEYGEQVRKKKEMKRI
jgi:hypothetical protein